MLRRTTPRNPALTIALSVFALLLLAAPAQAVCGDGILDLGEQCDDSNTVGGDCCDAACQFETLGSSCDDGDICTVTDTCDGAGTCDPGTPDPADIDGDGVCDAADICAPVIRDLMKFTISGIFTAVPPEMLGTIDPGDPFDVDVIFDSTLPNEVAAPDYLVTDPGILNATLVIAVKGPIYDITVNDATGAWNLTGLIDVQLIAQQFPLGILIESPLNSGMVPDFSASTSDFGFVDLNAIATGFAFFDVTGVSAAVPHPDPSDDTVDTDMDGIPDDCDLLCPNDPGNDDDSDGLCALVDNCPDDSNPGQEDYDSDGTGDVCDASPGFPLVPGLQGWGVAGLVVLLLASSLIMIGIRRPEGAA